ncbi:MAG TPA: phage portal protein [Acidimicrobiales bacterium]|nr:phage portal protein [Acidimicrobiales bacterium]
MKWPWSRKRRATFDSPPRNIVELFAEMYSATGTSVTRRQALSVPAVRRGRNLVCSVATMPLEQYQPDFTVAESALLRQIDPDVPNVVTLAQTVEDLLFDGIGWWLVTSSDFAGFPVSARHLDVGTVSLEPPGDGKSPAPLPSGIDPRRGVVWVDGKAVGGDRIIRFDSPNPAVLQHAGREIRRAIALDKAAVMYADDPRPADYFAPADGADEIDDDEIQEILAKWKWSRKRRATAWVPKAMTYHSVDSPAPRDLQLVELQRQVNLDIANALGIDPEDLGISTTSRTYANDVDRRRNKLNEVLAPYMQGITGRLSMGDVTRRGYTVAFNTTEYLQPNPTERWATYATAKALEAITVDEIRTAERKPPMPEIEEPAPPPDPVTDPDPDAGQGDTPAEEDDTVTATQPAAMTFDTDRGLTFTDVPVTEFSVDLAGRTIEGLALPYGKIGAKYGQKFRFAKGALSWSEVGRVKLTREHGPAIGRAVKLTDSPAGLRVKFKIARGDAGDEALLLAEDGVLDGLSVGVDFDMAADTAPDPKDRAVTLVRRADLREVALTAMPAFDDARVTSVAASRTGDNTMLPCNACGQVHAEGVACTATTTEPPAAPEPTGLTLTQEQLTAVLTRPGVMDQLTAALAQQGNPQAPAAPAGGLTLTTQQVDDMIQSGQFATMLGLPAPAAPTPEPEGPEPVNPTRGPVLFVHEALPYRFSRPGVLTRSDHDFSNDLHEMALARDHSGQETDAGKRVMKFLAAVFADQRTFADTTTGDVNELNPTINRPDMYVDQRDFRYPIWESINRGGPPNGVQPFMFPKFLSATGLVGDHTEGVEPTGGEFITTSQTVTPTPTSGKASITREVWDMGGNPAVSTLIFNQMVRGWNEGLESAAATFLNTLTAAVDITLGVGATAVDEVLIAAWDAAVAGLQFVRGYDFTMFAVEQVLYLTFVAASDNDGRKLVPQINPQNASGSASRRFTQLDLAGVVGTPSWALPSTPGALNNSWLFDPATVWGWASAPQRLEFPGSGGAAAGVEYKPVAHVDLAIWGYKAFANTDIGGVRQVTYDSVT